MLVNIKMKPGFLYLSTSSTMETDVQEVPMPTSGAPFTTVHRLRTQESADGSIAGQKIGRARSQQEMSWARMDCTTWWAINAWLENNGPEFWCNYFDYNFGQWRTRKMYVQQVSCTPYRPGAENSTDHGKPQYLQNATITFYDLGA